MNENNNRVQNAIPEKEYNSIVGLLGQLEEALEPYFVGVSDAEKISLPKINVDNKAFVEDAISSMQKPIAGRILPAFVNPADAKQDLEMFRQMDHIMDRFENLSARAKGTRIVAGSEAYSSSLTFKKLAEAAEAAGISGADEIAARLRERFRGQGKVTETATPTEETVK